MKDYLRQATIASIAIVANIVITTITVKYQQKGWRGHQGRK